MTRARLRSHGLRLLPRSQTEAFVAPASAVVTRTAVRSAEPAMFGGGKKSAPKKVVKKAASKPAAKKVAKKPVAKKVVKRAAPKPVAKKAGKKGGLFFNGPGAMSSKSGKEDSYQNRIFGASKKSLYPEPRRR